MDGRQQLIERFWVEIVGKNPTMALEEVRRIATENADAVIALRAQAGSTGTAGDNPKPPRRAPFRYDPRG